MFTVYEFTAGVIVFVSLYLVCYITQYVRDTLFEDHSTLVYPEGTRV